MCLAFNWDPPDLCLLSSSHSRCKPQNSKKHKETFEVMDRSIWSHMCMAVSKFIKLYSSNAHVCTCVHVLGVNLGLQGYQANALSLSYSLRQPTLLLLLSYYCYPGGTLWHLQKGLWYGLVKCTTSIILLYPTPSLLLNFYSKTVWDRVLLCWLYCLDWPYLNSRFSCLSLLSSRDYRV
jgi:hypothetical protein